MSTKPEGEKGAEAKAMMRYILKQQGVLMTDEQVENSYAAFLAHPFYSEFTPAQPAAAPLGEEDEAFELFSNVNQGLRDQIAYLEERYEIASANWQTEVDAKNAEIELLRQNGASLRPGISILDVLKWAVDNTVHKEMGMWRVGGGILAYTDERLVEVFLEQHPGMTEPQLEGRLKANGVALLKWGEKNNLRRTILGSWDISRLGRSMQFRDASEVYDQFAADEVEENKNRQA
jgi:hypothetical protein